MDKPLNLVLATSLQNGPSSHDVRPHEVAGFENGPVDVGLRGEMDHGVRGLRHAVHELSIAYVALHEHQVPVVLVILQVVRVPGVGQLVHDDDFVVAGGQPAPYKTASDEAHPARDEEACHTVLTSSGRPNRTGCPSSRRGCGTHPALCSRTAPSGNSPGTLVRARPP